MSLSTQNCFSKRGWFPINVEVISTLNSVMGHKARPALAACSRTDRQKPVRNAKQGAQGRRHREVQNPVVRRDYLGERLNGTTKNNS